MVDLSSVPGNLDMTPIQVLFSESHSRYLLTVQEGSAHEVITHLTGNGVPTASIGRVEGKMLVIDQAGLTINVEELKNAYQGAVEKFMS